MSFFQSISILLLFLPPFCMFTTTHAEGHDENLRIYIVHVRPPPPQHRGTDKQWHESFLLNSSRLLHSFTHALSGFSAELTPSELDHIRSLEGFLHASVSETHELHTTHSPSFLHLNTDPSAFWEEDAKYGEGTIIGVLDTGIAPTHPSFNSTDMPKPPSKWNGTCDFSGSTFPCNNKIIGGKNFLDGEKEIPPYDEDGHGTHVAGIAAGRFVPDASVHGSARGTAAGIAPYAHIAVYKVCHNDGCLDHVVAAAMDEALSNRVDVISISIGDPATRFDKDIMAISGYNAVKRGVFVSMSGGNHGPFNATVDNIPPWVLTVGASTMDRRIRAVVKLGNGTELVGESAYQPSNIPDYLPLIFPQWPGDVNFSYCSNVTTLKQIGVEGKIVLCLDGNATEASSFVKEAGGAAMIFWGSPFRGYDTYVFDDYEIPASYVSYADGWTIFQYYNSTGNANATIRFEGTAIGGSSDPAVAAFSSRGPSKVHRGILKPDIIGPGVNVLAASNNVPSFVMKSGTSMSCPHLAGVAALLKNSHPDWSPAMIKSAIMTTADVTNSGGRPIMDLYDNSTASLYAMGAGHVNPVRANNPGLVYDIQPDDYIPYLCGLGYTDVEVHRITKNHTISCADYTPIDEANLNYPSITVSLSAANNFTARIERTLTNVGSTDTTYSVDVHSPHGIAIEVSPRILQFSSAGQKQSFRVLFGKNTTENTGKNYLEGYLIWTSSPGSIKVRSPIMIQLA